MENNSNIQNTIDQHMKTLPHDVQEAIHASSWERKILMIGRKYGLHVDQLEILQTELSLAVLGLTGRDEFIRETMHEARIDRETMNLMVVDINREIFEPIRDHLRKTRQMETEQEERNEQKVSLSGLEDHEEETLRRHGVSFSFDEDEEEQQYAPAPAFSNPAPVQPSSVSPSVPQKTLEQPLVLKQNPSQSKPQALSFEDILKNTNLKPTSLNSAKPQEVAQTSMVSNEPSAQVEEKNESSKNPFDVEINPDALPSAKTDQHQNMIKQSKAAFYEKGDPYREPIG